MSEILANLSKSNLVLTRDWFDKNSVKRLAIGRFDGLHLGHLQLLKRLQNAEEAGIFLIKSNQNLTPPTHFAKFCGMQFFAYDIEDLRQKSGEEFAEFLCGEFKGLEKVVVGYDFKFAKNRSADAQDLREMLAKRGVAVEVVEEFRLDGVAVHSSLIRALLARGEVDEAAKFLGRNYTIFGSQISGQGLGGRELFATINLDAGEFLTPKFGVYAAVVRLKERALKAVVFVGNRLSTDLKFSIEAHILEPFSQEDLGGEIGVEFVKFLRQNAKFDELSQLKEQIAKDIANARQILA